MNLRTALAVFAIVGITGIASNVRADDEDQKPKNLKILQDNGKALQNGMKALSKGLGMKCFDSCHVKGEMDSDQKAAKEDGRKFLTAVVGEKDKAKREAALKELLAALKKDKAKDEAEIWKGVELFKKK
jgi:hypothetical protein